MSIFGSILRRLRAGEPRDPAAAAATITAPTGPVGERGVPPAPAPASVEPPPRAVSKAELNRRADFMAGRSV